MSNNSSKFSPKDSNIAAHSSQQRLIRQKLAIVSRELLHSSSQLLGISCQAAAYSLYTEAATVVSMELPYIISQISTTGCYISSHYEEWAVREQLTKSANSCHLSAHSY